MKYWIGIGVFVLCMACQDVRLPEKPENLIEESTMVDILADAYTGNAARSVNNRVLKDQGVLLDSILYKKYDIDSLQFAKSNAYYTSNFAIYSKMLKQVTTELEQRKIVVDTLVKLEKEATRRKRDSLRRLDSLAKRSIKKSEKGTLINSAQD